MRLFCTAGLAGLLLCGPAIASPYPIANEYFKVRDAAKIVQSFSHDDVVLRPQRFEGCLLEVRGMIVGLAGADDQLTLLLKQGDNLPPVAAVAPPSAVRAQWPFLQPDNRVRLLCKVAQDAGSSTGNLAIVSAVVEHEASSVDNSRAQQALREAAAKRSGGATRLSSRRANPAGATAGTRAALSRAQYVQVYANAVQYFNRRLSRERAEAIAGAIIENSVRNGLDARLVMAVVACESNFNTNAVSRVGAMGLGQLMPGTASDLGVGNAFDLDANLDGSTRLLKQHIGKMSKQGEVTEEAIKLALACYNAGPGAVKKHGGIPPYRETQNYVKKVTRLYRQFCGLDD